MTSRRDFLTTTALAAAAMPLRAAEKKPLFTISLAEWSLHRAILQEKSMTNLEFVVRTKRDFGIDAVEYVNQCFMDKATDKAYLTELKKVCDAEGVQSVLIMCDREGNLGDPDAAKRSQAVTNHHKWADAAKFLGCHSIRVNAATGNAGSFEEQQKRAADGLRKLSEYCANLGLNCIVENHGGLSSHGGWLAGVMKMVNLPNCGTLPDFGNFTIDGKSGEKYDRYKGVEEMMPYAKGVSAKSMTFDAEGNETETDYRRMMKIVLAAGYHGRVGIEYSGPKLSEPEGIRATKKLLEKIRDEMA
jgi:sugar phosphate isomerase/epimerase